ncbi:MAG: TetR/AcrR family transcriptional regulator [Acidimicrobiia bacterium]|nr:TetR/AcrR family transcriptional regulator [Acidimicrobiia bacterium]
MASSKSRQQATSKAPGSRRRAVSDEDKRARRATILGAAKTVFARDGFHEATIADIAREAGIAYGSIYWYFDSKDELFRALMDDQEAQLRDRLVAVMLSRQGDTDPEAIFRSAIGETLRFFEADRAATRLVFREALRFGSGIQKHLYGIYEHFIDDLATVVGQLQAGGLIRRDAPPRALAFCAAALIGQLAYRRLSTDDGIDTDTAVDFVASLLMDGMRAA